MDTFNELLVFYLDTIYSAVDIAGVQACQNGLASWMLLMGTSDG
jgi:hypothetical protein